MNGIKNEHQNSSMNDHMKGHIEHQNMILNIDSTDGQTKTTKVKPAEASLSVIICKEPNDIIHHA